MSSVWRASRSVVHITRQCTALFARGLSNQTLDSRLRIDLENQLGRFKIWVGNIGVFAAGNASLDARLRDDLDIKEIMIQMLTRLWKLIDQLINPPLSEAEDEDNSDSSQSTSSSSTSPSLDVSLGGTSETGDFDEPLAQQTHQSSQKLLQDIDSIITRLYRLSTIIRKPISFSENAKVARFIDKTDEGEDAKEYVSHIRWVIQTRRHPGASAVLIDRLVDAVVLRRKKLLYRERHQQKLNQGTDREFTMELTVPERTYPAKAPERNARPVPRQNTPFLKVAATVKSSQTVPLSATEASSVNRQGLATYASSVAPSGMTRSAISRREQLDVPRPPRLQSETEEAICPYCFQIMKKTEMIGMHWTRHILKDIDPYICLFEECNNPNGHFKTVEAWLSHMRWNHTLLWSCQNCQNGSSQFDSEAGLEQHMRQMHCHDITYSQLPVILQKSAQPAPDLFNVLACQSKTVNYEAGEVCPLCPFKVQGLNLKPQKDPSLLGAEISDEGVETTIRNHIAAHLEALAMLSLPDHDDLDDAPTEEAQSQSAKYSSRQGDQDLPPAIFLNDEKPLTAVQRDDVDQLSIDAEPPPPSDDEDWEYVYTKSRKKIVTKEPGQDPVLRKFVEREREIQMIEWQKKSNIPTIVVYDPDGFELSVTQPVFAVPILQDVSGRWCIS